MNRDPRDLDFRINAVVPRESTSVRYRVALLLVATAVVLLPLVYLAIVGLVAYGVYYHAVYNHGPIMELKGSFRNRQIIYLVPVVAGGSMVFFMLKPLFPAKEPAVPCTALDSSRERGFASLVAQIAGAIGAPQPSQVRLTNDVNASAAFGDGLAGYLRGELVLTLGLPLVSGLTLRQLSGIIAHELGHCSQTFGMRLTWLIRHVNQWFARVVYERDAWDDTLARWNTPERQWKRTSYWYFQYPRSIVAFYTRIIVWASRRVLQVLMFLGAAISGYMLRQMELDADLLQSRLSGSSEFVPTFAMLHFMSRASHQAVLDLEQRFDATGEIRNFTAEVQRWVDRIPESAAQPMLDSLEQTKTRWFDTHPSARDRIAHVRENPCPGILDRDFDRPASDAFRDFDSLCEDATAEIYRAIAERTESSR